MTLLGSKWMKVTMSIWHDKEFDIHNTYFIFYFIFVFKN